MIKVCHYPSVNEQGIPVVEMLDPGNSMVKLATPYLPEVQQYVRNLRPRAGSVYALVNAIGAYEFWSSNINGDAAPERYDAGHAVYDQLIHEGPIWGYQTFLGANPFTHHVNKDPAKSLGAIELSAYNKTMHRVEVVVRLDRDKCNTPAASRFMQRIDAGELPDVSMGMKVPFDMCSVCTDWDAYNTALRTFDPFRHRHPGIAVLMYHKQIRPIRGLSVLQEEYCSHVKGRMNHILHNGAKIFVWNHWMRFFDLSLVFIGAERQAKMMAKLAEGRDGGATIYPPPHGGWPTWGANGMDKTASMKTAAKIKQAIKEKHGPPPFESRAIPIVRGQEKDLPRNILNTLGSYPLGDSMSSTTTLGVVLKPREFQRVVLIRLGLPEVADDMDDSRMVFQRGPEVDRSIGLSRESVIPELIRALSPFLAGRSCFGPPLRRRMIQIRITGLNDVDDHEQECISPLLKKIGAAYNGYCNRVIEKIAELSMGLHGHPDAAAEVMGIGLHDLFAGPEKWASLDPAVLLGSIPSTYLADLARH